MSKVGIFFATGYEEIEALTVVDLLRRVHMDARMIAIDNAKQVVGSHDIAVTMDEGIADTDFEQLDMIVLPGGGEGTKRLEACAELMEQVDKFYETNKCVAAICAAPSILGHRGILQGKRACAYPTFEKELTGAEVVPEAAVTADNVITGRGMGCSTQFALAIVTYLLGKEEADKLAEKIVFMQ